MLCKIHAQPTAWPSRCDAPPRQALHKQTQEEFARKVHVYQKTIKTLLAKLNALDAAQQQELQKVSEPPRLDPATPRATCRAGGPHAPLA